MATKENPRNHESSSNISFVSDLNPTKDMWNMKARIIRKWNQGFKMNMILLDEKGSKIEAVIKSNLIPVFYQQLQQDHVVMLSKFGVGENNEPFKVVNHIYKINFYRCTTVQKVDSWQGLEYGFNLVDFRVILNGDAKELLAVDVAGTVVLCGYMGIYGHPPKQTKKINFDLQDLEGTILKCTMWNNYAEEFSKFISINSTTANVFVVIQHAKVKSWEGKWTVQSDKYGTRLFLNEEIDEINQLRRSLIVKQGQESGSTSQTILSSQTVYPLHQEFVLNTPMKHVDEIAEIDKEMFCVVVATIKIVQESYGWFYPACRQHSRKVLTKAEYLQNLEIVPDEIMKLPTTALICPKCERECTSITTKFKVQVRVQDETGSVSFVMFDRDVMKIVGSAANDIRERQVMGNDTQNFPYEISRLVDKKLAFKIEVSKFNLTHEDYHVYTVQKICDDPLIIVELLGENNNADLNIHEVVDQEDNAFPVVNLSNASQVEREQISKDVVSVMGDSSVVEDEKDSATSPNGKRVVESGDSLSVGELSSTKKRIRNKE